MRALVLGHALDPTVKAVTLALRQRHGAASVHQVAIGELQRARWEHAMDAHGGVTTRIDACIGAERRDIARADVVFNRVERLPALQFAGWTDIDQCYGRSEWLALLLSWLASYGSRVVNAPQFGTLAGPPDRAWLWLARAAAAGLPVHACGATTSVRRFPPPRGALSHPALLADVPEAAFSPLPLRAGYAVPAADMLDAIVVGEHVFVDALAGDDAIDPATRAACARLAAESDTPVLGVRLARSEHRGEWRFVAANPSPVVEGGATLDALVALLERRGSA